MAAPPAPPPRADAAPAASPDPAAAAASPARRLARARALLEFAVQRARVVHLPQVAASLTFSSVLSLVPLLAVVLAVFTAFPQFAQLRQSLEQDLPRSLLPVPYARTILAYLAEFAAKAAGVGVAGLSFLALTALSMILTVDRILNDIWQVHQRRPLTQRVLVYWMVLSVGPVLLGLSLTLTSYLVSLSYTHSERWGSGVRPLLTLVSPLIATVAYSAAYALVPNRRVRWRHAFAGGLVTAVIDELMSRGFAAYVIHGSFLTIYGAFAAVPIFLTWIYLSWLSFLFGAALAAALPQIGNRRFDDSRWAGDRAITAMALVKLLHDGARGGVPRAVPLAELARVLRTDEEELQALLGDLEAMSYVRRVAASRTAPEAWIVACDARTQGLGPIFRRYGIDPRNSLLQRRDLDLPAWLGPALRGPWLDEGFGRLPPSPPGPLPHAGEAEDG